MRWKTAVYIVLCAAALRGAAETFNSYKMVDGRILSGRPTGQYKDTGFQLKLESGGYSNYSWGVFSTDSLAELAKDKKAAPFASVFLDEPAPMAAPKVAKKGKDLPATWAPKPVERMERPVRGSLLGSPLMIGLLGLMYLANLYAGYAVALFRQQPYLMVCGLSMVAPVVVPAIFLALPPREPEEEVEEAPAAEAAPDTAAGGAAEAAALAAQAQPAAPTGPVLPATVIYQRGQTTFNRRFFETKFAGFMKVVPGESEKDMLIVIESARGNLTGQRLSRVQPNDLVLHITKGHASEDVTVPYGEILLIKVKHKDSPD